MKDHLPPGITLVALFLLLGGLHDAVHPITETVMARVRILLRVAGPAAFPGYQTDRRCIVVTGGGAP